MTGDRIAGWAMIQYGMLAMPLAFAGMPLYVHAPDVYATQYGVSLSALGAILLLLRLVDAVQDPLIGYVSDKLSAYRTVIIVIAAVCLVLGFAGLFHPVPHGTLLWFAATMLLATTAYSVMSINLNSIGGLWSRNHHEKTRIAATREGLGLVGLLLAVILPSVFALQFGTEHAFTYVSLVCGTLMLLALGAYLYWSRHHAPQGTNAEKPISFIRQARSLPGPTKRLFGVYGLSMLASSMPAVLVMFFIRDRLEAEYLTGAFLAAYFLSAVLAMPLWQRLSRYIGKTRAWSVAMGLAVISFAGASFLGAGDLIAYGMICVFSGAALGADLIFPPSLLADQLHVANVEAQANFHFSVMTFLLKASLALAAAISLPTIEWVGFQPGAANEHTALLALSLAYAGVPCLLKLASAVWLWRLEAILNTGNCDAKSSHLSTHRRTYHA